MQTITRDHVIYQMSAGHPCAARAISGETVIFETWDCFGGQITREDQHLNGIDWANINPATGPLYVEGAQPGDVLKVEILHIDLDDHGVMTETPGEGPYGSSIPDEATKILPVSMGCVTFNDRLSFPIRPMIGVIGTAPAGEAIPTGTPGPHGGNMDCQRIGPGSILYLPVEVPGALLAMGDLHAVMGDGEVCICGVEISGSITVRVTVLRDCVLPTPFLVTPEHFMNIYAADTMDAAAKGAVERMRAFLIEQVGMEAHDAGMVLSAVCDLRVCQMVDPMITCRMEVSRDIPAAYGYAFP